ncbi:hypothetical protein Tco_1103262 [Tanacetum coccineum]
MLAICVADTPVVFKAPKTSSKAKSVSQGTKPGAKPGHKKLSTSSKQPSVSSKEATKVGPIKHPPVPKLAILRKEKSPQVTGDPTSLRVTSEARANPQLSSDQIKSVSEGLETVLTQPRTGKGANSIARQNKVEAETALLKAQSSFPNVGQLNELLIKPIQTEFSKILFAHDFSSSLPTKLKDLPSKFNELTKEVKGLKKQVHELEIELPVDLKEIPTKLEDFTKTVTSLTSHVTELKTLQWELPTEFLSLPVQVTSVQAKLKTLDALLGLLLNVTKALNKFPQVLDSASSKLEIKDAEEVSTESDSDDETTYVPGSMVESSKKKDLKRREGEMRKEELVDLLSIEVVNKYYNDKLQYDKYRDKMLNRRAKSRITNYDILTRKGPITLKVYREDDTSKIIPEFKASDLHLGEWK